MISMGNRMNPAILLVTTLCMTIVHLTTVTSGMTVPVPEGTIDSDGVTTSESHSRSETIYSSMSTEATVTLSTISATVAVVAETMASGWTWLSSATSIAVMSTVTNQLTTTAPSTGNLETRFAQTLTPDPDTETYGLSLTENTIPSPLQGTPATMPSIESTLRVKDGSTSYASTDGQYPAGKESGMAVSLSPVVSRRSTDSIATVTDAQPMQPSTLSDTPAGSVNIASTLLMTGVTASTAAQFPFTGSPAVQEVASAKSDILSTTLSGVATEKATTDDAWLVSRSSSINTSSGTGGAKTDSAFLVTMPTVQNNSDDGIAVEAHAQTEQPYANLAITGDIINVTSTTLPTAAAANTGAPYSRSSPAQATASKNSGVSLTELPVPAVQNSSDEDIVVTAHVQTEQPNASLATTGDALSVTSTTQPTAAAANTGAPYSRSSSSQATASTNSGASLTESPDTDALTATDTATLTSRASSVKTAVSTASWLASHASPEGGATTTDAAAVRSSATLTFISGYSRSATVPTTSTPLLPYDNGVMKVVVVTTAVVFAGVAVIACVFALLKCCDILRTRAARKHPNSSYETKVQLSDGLSLPAMSWRQSLGLSRPEATSAGRAASKTAAAVAPTESHLLSLWAGSEIHDVAPASNVHVLPVENPMHKPLEALGGESDGQVNGEEQLPLGAKLPLLTFRGVPPAYRSVLASNHPTPTATKIEEVDKSLTANGESHIGDVTQYVRLSGDDLARTVL